MKHDVVNWIVRQPEVARLSPTTPTPSDFNVLFGDRFLSVTESFGKYRIHFFARRNGVGKYRKFGMLTMDEEDEKKFSDWFLSRQKIADHFELTGEAPAPCDYWESVMAKKKHFISQLSPAAQKMMAGNIGWRFTMSPNSINFPIKLWKVNLTTNAAVAVLNLLAELKEDVG